MVVDVGDYVSVVGILPILVQKVVGGTVASVLVGTRHPQNLPVTY